MVSVKVPLGLPAVTVIVGVPDPVTEGGLKLADAPPGKPVTLKVTGPVNPSNGVTGTGDAVLWLRRPQRADAVAEGEKSALGWATTSVTEVVGCRLPLVPVMING